LIVKPIQTKIPCTIELARKMLDKKEDMQDNHDPRPPEDMLE
jgi:hypothetical protein